MTETFTTAYSSDVTPSNLITDLFEAYGIKRAKLITQSSITTGGNRWNQRGADTPNEEATREEYITNQTLQNEQWIAEEDFDGIIIIDWETPFNAVFNNGAAANPTEHAAIMVDYIALMQHLKAVRPNARVTVWGWPTRGAATHSTYYADAADTVDMLAEMDAMCPQFYAATATPSMTTQMQNLLGLHLAIAKDVAWKESEDDPGRGLTVSAGTTKPVWAFCDHRQLQIYGNELLSETEFKDWYGAVRDWEWLGTSMDGLALWNSDHYWLSPVNGVARLWRNAARDGVGSPPSDWLYNSTQYDNMRAVYESEGFSDATTDEEIDTYMEGRNPDVYEWMNAVMSGINTRRRRQSTASVARPWRPTPVLPDGTIDAADRAFAGWSYAGLVYDAPPDAPVPEAVRVYSWSHATETVKVWTHTEEDTNTFGHSTETVKVNIP